MQRYFESIVCCISCNASNRVSNANDILKMKQNR